MENYRPLNVTDRQLKFLCIPYFPFLLYHAYVLFSAFSERRTQEYISLAIVLLCLLSLGFYALLQLIRPRAVGWMCMFLNFGWIVLLFVFSFMSLAVFPWRTEVADVLLRWTAIGYAWIMPILLSLALCCLIFVAIANLYDCIQARRLRHFEFPESQNAEIFEPRVNLEFQDVDASAIPEAEIFELQDVDASAIPEAEIFESKQVQFEMPVVVEGIAVETEQKVEVEEGAN